MLATARTPLSRSLVTAGVALLGCPAGCFTTRDVGTGELRGMARPVVARLRTAEGQIRGLIRPGDVGEASIRYYPLRHGPDSWVVRFGGWPIVYTSGKHLRYETTGEVREAPLSPGQRLTIERYSWPLTVLSLPATLPPGTIDFLFQNLRWGFEEVDTEFDTPSWSSDHRSSGWPER